MNLQQLKTASFSVKSSQLGALLGLAAFIAYGIYGMVFDYFDFVVFLALLLGTVCAQTYVLVKKSQYLNLLSVVSHSFGLGLLFLNSYPVWADWYGNFTMYGSRGGVAPVILLILLTVLAILCGMISCFTIKREDVNK
ncbi:MAG: hypothetical protein HDT38_03235 [Clostridiales bacterium]|nr:hypothetical protein [Clostridiales bacterium]